MLFKQENTQTEEESNRSNNHEVRKAAKRKNDNGWDGEGWHGYMREKERKLQEQFESLNSKRDNSQQKSNIFEGVCIFVNGYTNPSSDHLKQIMAEHGGQYQHYYSRRKCTHTIATNLPNSKIKELKDEKVVHPDWIVESVKAGQLLPIEKYRLYSGKKEAKAFANFQPKPIGSESNKLKNDNCSIKKLSSKDEKSSGLTDADCFAAFDEEISGYPIVNATSSDPLHSKSRYSQEPSTSALPNEKHFSVSTISRNNLSIEQQNELSAIPTTDIPYSDAANDANESFSMNEIFDSCLFNDDNGNTDSGDTTKGETENFPLDAGKTDNAYAEVKDDHTTKGPYLTKHDYSNTSPTKAMGKAGDPGFMSEFYSNSRLHHLSMWKSELKRFATMIHKASLSKNLKKTSKGKSEKLIMHIDMDSFFVSVALKDRPELKGKPIAVCHASKGTATAASFNSKSEIASCSYEARSKGVRNGMFLGTARTMCPELICVPYYFESYRTVSQKFYEILVSFTSEIEAVSCDEALLDISNLVSEEMTVMDLAARMRADILKETECSASVGVASNILLARMATRKAKPNGQFHLQKKDVLDFVGCQKVSDLPGVGYSMQSKLLAIGVNTCADLRQFSLHKLKEKFGPKTGQSLYNNCRGIDDRQLKTDHERQSVSAEINYGIRFVEHHETHSFLFELAKEVSERLQAIEMKGSHITLKLMIRKKGAPEPLKHMGHGICDNVSKSATISQPTDNANIIGKEIVNLLQQFKIVASDIRGMGIQVAKLVNSKSGQKMLKTIDFGNQSKAKCIDPFKIDEKAGNTESNVEGLDPQQVEIKLPSKAHTLKEKSPVKGFGKKQGKKLNNVTKKATSLSKYVTKIPLKDALSGEFDVRKSRGTEDPPLPSLSGSPKKEGRSSRSDNFGSNLGLPPLSEIDPTVFYELPEDVRKSISEAYKQRNQVLNVKPCSSNMLSIIEASEKCLYDTSENGKSGRNDCLKTNEDRLVSDPNPKGDEIFFNDESAYPKHVSDALVENANRPYFDTVEDKEQNQPVMTEKDVYNPPESISNFGDEELTLSTIDPEVLKALPPHIRDEVLQSVKLQNKRTLRSNENGQHQANKMLPAKGRIKEKTDKSKMQFEKRKQESTKQKKIFTTQTCKEIVPNGNVPSKTCQSAGASMQLEEKEESKGIKDGSKAVPQCHSCESVKLPSLNGIRDHRQVKDLTKAWVLSADDPLMEDVEEFVTYIEELFGCLCMEQAFTLLKMLKRLSSKSELWTMNWESISSRVQQFVENRYGGTLSL
ncbi:DNA repair protein REV1-like [Rhopilema esculentum]|uniref:DNA repair protein REV1-like n=1 Tax=Rhopilema esculentum TaxID=499914 RepID=UPI0031DF6D5C